MTKRTKEEIIKNIKKEITYVDIKPYSHNIIGLELEILARDYGEEEVHNIVKNTKLKDLGWGYILELKKD